MGAGQPEADIEDSVKTVTPGIHTHGVSSRILLVGSADHNAILRELGWSPRHRGWLRSEPTGGPRWQLRSSAWLTGRRASPSSGLGRRNRQWDTAITNLDIQQSPGGWALNIETVRRTDIDTLMESVLGLAPSQWKVAYVRRLERFVCVSSREAHRLSVSVGLREDPVRGRIDGDNKTHRKAYLIRPGEWTFPVTIRTRARANVDLVLYQVVNGATAGTWKLEARLQRKTNRLAFSEDGGQRVLDQVLETIIDKHQLDTVTKPARWEPRPTNDSRRTAGDIAGLPMACWRGPEPAAAKFDTPPSSEDPLDGLALVRARSQSPLAFQPVAAAPIQGAPAGGDGISCQKRSDDSWKSVDGAQPPKARSRAPASGTSGSGSWPPCSSSSTPCQRLLSRTGSLIEFIHDKDDDPVAIAQGLSGQMGSGLIVSGSVLTSRSMASQIKQDIHFGWWLADHPLDRAVLSILDEERVPDLREHVLFVVVNERVLCDTPLPVPLDEHGEEDLEAQGKVIADFVSGGEVRSLARRMEERLAAFFHGLRVMCERSGLRVVLLVPEAKPVGSSGARDRNLRSLTGDAGRYYSHLRLYRPRGARVTEVWKDAIEGLGPGWLSPGGRGSGGQLPDVEGLMAVQVAGRSERLLEVA